MILSTMTAYAQNNSERLLETGTTFRNENNGAWSMADCDGDGKVDLIFIKTMNTPNNKTEVHIASASSNYQSRLIDIETAFTAENNGTWLMADCDMDGKPDLVYIKTSNTPNNLVEVHIASASSNYQSRIVETQTTYSNENNGIWTMADCDGDGRPDLVYIKSSNTPNNKVEVHAASAASNYQSRIIATPSAFFNEYNGTWDLKDFDGDGRADLIYIKTSNTPNNQTEVHVASAASNFQSRVKEVPTAFTCENNGAWSLQRFGGGYPKICYLKTQNTTNNTVEVHIASF